MHEWLGSDCLLLLYLGGKVCVSNYHFMLDISDGAGSIAQNQISDEKNRMVAVSVSAHPRKLLIFLLLQCFPVPLTSYCIVFSSGRATVQELLKQELLEVEVDGKPHTPHSIP